MTQLGFCPKCGQHGPLHELHKDDDEYRRYRRFRKTYSKPELYCDRCIDRIKHQQAVDRRDAVVRRYDRERKYGRPYHGR